MEFSEVLEDRQAEARTADLSRAAAVCTEEPFENTVLMFGQDAFPGVRNGNYRIVSTLIELDRYRTILPIEFDRIVDQVRQHLFQPRRVGQNLCITRDMISEFDPSGSGFSRKACEYLVDDRGRPDRTLFDRYLAAFDKRQFQNVRYQRVHSFGVTPDNA